MWSFFRNCNYCGYGIFKNGFKRIEFFCDQCWLKLQTQKAPNNFKLFKEHGLVIRPLYLWKDDEKIVARLIHGMKGGGPKSIYKKIAKELVIKNFNRKKITIVPIPSSKVGENDHAFMLAKIISEELNAELWCGLNWENKIKKQKFLRKTERFEAEMKTDEKPPDSDAIILIDDLVTTGATVIAAHKAIKSLNKIEVWSVACRI